MGKKSHLMSICRLILLSCQLMKFLIASSSEISNSSNSNTSLSSSCQSNEKSNENNGKSSVTLSIEQGKIEISSKAEIPNEFKCKCENEDKDEMDTFLYFQKLLRSPSRMKLEKTFNIDRVKMINQSIDEIYKEIIPYNSHSIFTMDISNLIGAYEHSNPLDEIYEKVMKRLDLKAEKEGVNLDFYDDNFAINFFNIISGKKDKFPYGHSFWYEMERLFFKWAIQKKQENVNNPEGFKKISTSLEPIILLIVELTGASFSSNLQPPHSKEVYNFTIFEQLLHCEFYDNHDLFHTFSLAIKDFYNGIVGLESGKQENFPLFSCNELKEKYFDGKSFDGNILLKYLIVMHDPMGMMRECIIKDDPYSKRPRTSPLIDEISSAYLDDLSFKGPREIRIIHMRYASRSIMKFFLSRNLRFDPRNPEDLINLLKKLKNEDLLTGKMVKRIIGFSNIQKKNEHDDDFKYIDNRNIKWDRGKFKEFLVKYKESNCSKKNIQSEYIRYLKLID